MGFLKCELHSITNTLINYQQSPAYKLYFNDLLQFTLINFSYDVMQKKNASMDTKPSFWNMTSSDTNKM